MAPAAINEPPALPPPPGPLPGTEALTPRTLRRLLWVSFRHLDPGLIVYIVGVSLLVAAFQLAIGWLSRSALLVVDAVALGAAAFVACLVSVPIGILWSLRRWRQQGWVVGYFDDTVTQLVHPDEQGAWLLSDHHAFKRGRGLAAPFRRAVFRHLASEADRSGVDIVTDTRARKLAGIYMDDMPGLVIEGDCRRDFIGRRIYDLRRHPAQAAVDDSQESGGSVG